jgi:ribosomal protein S18 acetylase RimI-like enzyme
MSSIRIEPFEDGHLDGAAEVLAARHERHRAALPMLAQGDPQAALEALWRKGVASGAVGLRAGRVAAFVLAEVGERSVFGRSAWVPHAGQATDDDELLRDVYAAAAETWVEAGAERHYALVPAFAEALAPWYRLGFGHMHVEALRSLSTETRPAPELQSPKRSGAGGITLRLGTRADLESAEAIDLEIFHIQERSPSFVRLPLNRGARRDEWLEMDLDEDGLRYLVAEADSERVGHTIIYRPEPVLGYPEDAAYLASTAVREDLRGRGIGAGLVAEVLRLAAEAGYGSVVTNWRMTNLSASRFWPAQGFQPIYHRLHRALGSD